MLSEVENAVERLNDAVPIFYAKYHNPVFLSKGYSNIHEEQEVMQYRKAFDIEDITDQVLQEGD